jgi:hypothetical protein
MVYSVYRLDQCLGNHQSIEKILRRRYRDNCRGQQLYSVSVSIVDTYIMEMNSYLHEVLGGENY